MTDDHPGSGRYGAASLIWACAVASQQSVTVGETGPDWWWSKRGPQENERYYAQRGNGAYAFGATEHEAFENLLKLEKELHND